MKTRIAAAFIGAFVAASLVGCGGGRPESGVTGGIISVSISFPESTRSLPQATNSVRITATREDALSPAWEVVVARGEAATVTAKSDWLQPGLYTVLAQAYTSYDGSGQVIARAQQVVQVNSGRTVTVTLTTTALAMRVLVAPDSASIEVTDNAYIRAWLVNGTYLNGDYATSLDTDFLGGEASVTPSEGSSSGGKTWFLAQSTTDAVDLYGLFEPPGQCVAYAAAYVYSPTAQTVDVWMGSDDGIKLWVNGAMVWENNREGAYTADSDRTTASLNQGWNTVLAKVSQLRLAWQFSVKLCDSGGNRLSGVQYATNPAVYWTRQLNATAYDADDLVIMGNITWHSSNTAVATVDSSGLVTAVAPGDATITATETGSGANGTSSVHVESIDVP